MTSDGKTSYLYFSKSFILLPRELNVPLIVERQLLARPDQIICSRTMRAGADVLSGRKIRSLSAVRGTLSRAELDGGAR